jgi:class 3 adenylate cyclase
VNGEDAMVTVLFVDVRDFTPFADRVTAREGIIGDPVNVAARVEQATRRTGDSVLVTEATRCLMESDALEPHGTLELKGKPAPVAVYALGSDR